MNKFIYLKKIVNFVKYTNRSFNFFHSSIVTPLPKYFVQNVIGFVSIVCPILRKMHTGLQNLPNILVPKLPRYFVNFTKKLQCSQRKMRDDEAYEARQQS